MSLLPSCYVPLLASGYTTPQQIGSVALTSSVTTITVPPGLEAPKPGSRLTRLNYTKWLPFNPNGGDSLDYVDSNWTALLRVGKMGLSDEELRRSGASPDSVRLPPESGGGYLAYLASHHYLHCLYILHQSLHPEYYETRSALWNSSAERRLWHWNHCLEVMHQYVTCDVDATVVTHNWVEEISTPVATSANPRRCADWDAYFRWQLDRQVPAPRRPLSKPPDAVEIPLMPAHPPSDYLSMYRSG
ncbi:hypothetical protein F4677DRAFT_440669 [Hypoxylon crocopeplum]|nr:hypothetical protein F4677DRAFT_440669 [Hypoxylon crocopeplum]